jgi:serine/threonine-protein kinase
VRAKHGEELWQRLRNRQLTIDDRQSLKMALAPNTRLGPYAVLSPLGAGGMGEVYRARDTRLERDVAIKVLPRHLTQSFEFRQRFEREAKSISQLAHPNICTLHDVGHQDGIDYLVMELLEGASLADRLMKGPLPLDQVLGYGAEIASALDAAHRKWVVHRDLKPGNIMLTKTGARLLDFGLAKSDALLDSNPSAVTVTQPLTSKGMIVGTFQYMSPEQLEGTDADERTDIFALGAVLYEMATGKRAFDGSSRASLIASIMAGQPRPISELQPMTPPALDRLIRKCLAKDPDARWQSAADVADELRWVSEGGSDVGGLGVPTRAGRRTGEFIAWTLAFVLAVLAGLAWLLPDRSAREAGPLHLSLALPGTDVVDAGLENLAVALSPDGQSVAYCARGAGGISLYLRRLDQRDATRLAGTEDAYDPFFSPDGEWIGFFSGDKLRKVSVRGGVPIALADSVESRSGTWIDQQTIVFSATFSTPLMRVSAFGGGAEARTTLNVEKRERTHRWPDVMPGGEWVLFTVGSVDSPGGYDDSTIEAVSLKTRERRVLVNGGRMARYVPPGYLLFARGNVLFAAPIDPRDPHVTTAPLPVLDGVGGEDTSGASHFSVSENGTLAYVPGALDQADELVWVDMEGNIEPVGAPQRLYDQVRVSPDGKQLLIAAGPNRSAGDLWLFDLDRKTMTRITFDQKCTSPCWTPDQKHVVFRVEAGSYEIRVQALDSSEAPRVIHTDSDPILVSGVTPDGSIVMFQKYGSAISDVMMVPLDGGGPARALWEEPGAQYGSTVSPDGRWLAYAAGAGSGVDDIYVKGASGQGPKWQVSVDGGVVPLWAPDSKEVFYVRDDAMMAVSIEANETKITAGIPRKLFEFPPGRRAERDLRTFDIMPDGRRFVLLRSASPGMGRRQINIVLNWSEELKARVPRDRNAR